MILKAQNIVKSFRSKKAVDNVSLEVKQGQIIGLLGPNGAGKSTSFYMIVGLVRPDSGKIFLEDKEITKYPMYKRAQNGIGYLSQDPSVFRKLTVEDNILSILQLSELSKKQQINKMDSLLEEFGLMSIRKNRGDLLSGGERRRTEIARALASNPKFILLDEPFAGVDPIAVADIQAIIRQLAERNIGVLITDHNVRETFGIIDHGYIMNEGELMVNGPPQDLMRDEQARKIYLGDTFSM